MRRAKLPTLFGELQRRGNETRAGCPLKIDRRILGRATFFCCSHVNEDEQACDIATLS